MKIRRLVSFILTITVLFMFPIPIKSAYSASVRSAQTVLKDIISVKKQWNNTLLRSTKNYLHQQAEDLRIELKKTKEYKNNIKVSDRNFTIKKGRDPGFRVIVNVLCMPPNDTLGNVELAYDYIGAYNKSFWGSVCIVTGGIIFAGALAYGAVSYGVATTVGAAGASATYTASQWNTMVDKGIMWLSKYTDKIYSHILVAKHHWDLVVSKVNWSSVKPILTKALLYGKIVAYDGTYNVMEYCYKGCVIVVRYRIIDGIVKIGTAFVK